MSAKEVDRLLDEESDDPVEEVEAGPVEEAPAEEHSEAFEVHVETARKVLVARGHLPEEYASAPQQIQVVVTRKRTIQEAEGSADLKVVETEERVVDMAPKKAKERFEGLTIFLGPKLAELRGRIEDQLPGSVVRSEEWVQLAIPQMLYAEIIRSRESTRMYFILVDGYDLYDKTSMKNEKVRKPNSLYIVPAIPQDKLLKTAREATPMVELAKTHAMKVLELAGDIPVAFCGPLPVPYMAWHERFILENVGQYLRAVSSLKVSLPRLDALYANRGADMSNLLCGRRCRIRNHSVTETGEVMALSQTAGFMVKHIVESFERKCELF